MKINKLLALLFLATALAVNFSNVFAADGALDEVADEYNKNESNDKYKVVCRREAPVGSRIKKKVCRTVATMQNSQREVKGAMSKMRTTIGKQP